MEGIYILFTSFLILQLHRICMTFTTLLAVAGVIIVFAFLHWEFKVQFDDLLIYSIPLRKLQCVNPNEKVVKFGL